MKPLNLLYSIRIGLGIAAGLICTLDNYFRQIPGDKLGDISIFLTGLSYALLFYVLSYYALKRRFIKKVEKPSKVFTMGIGGYFLTWIVAWMLFFTLVQPYVHNVAVVNVTVSPTNVYGGQPVNIAVTVRNKGSFTENFKVIAYYDNTHIENTTVTSLAPNTQTIVTFNWNTTGVPSGNYIIKAVAGGIPSETDLSDNTFVDDTVTIKFRPIASFTHSPETPNRNELVTFNASTSYDLDGSIVNYTWNFGDINVTTVSTPIIKHVYSTPGDFLVNLTVTDNDDLKNSITDIVSVVGVHDVAVLSVTPDATQVKVGAVVNITVVVKNEGEYIETFDVMVYRNDALIENKTVNLLSPGDQITKTFRWDTTNVMLGNYTLSAKASVIPGETDTSDNVYDNGVVEIVS